MAPPKLSPDLRKKVIELLKQNRKVEAVKIVLQETGSGLANSKDAVDKIIEELKTK